MSRGQNPVGVAAFISGPTGVDEQRLAGWTHDQCGLTALHVDEVDLQGLRAGGSVGAKCTRSEYAQPKAKNSGQDSMHRLAPDLGDVAEDYATGRGKCVRVVLHGNGKARSEPATTTMLFVAQL
jgi:hypothetical protein